MPSPQDFLDGQLLLINKPKTWTSFDVVNKIRYALRDYTGNKKIKVGHAGTLDPLATGLLLICTGRATKQINQLQGLDKSYVATIKLGAMTPSYDAETDVSETGDISHLTLEVVERAMARFSGEVDQLPPPYSAIKKDGKKLYEFARAGKDVPLEPRKVSIHRFALLENRWPEIVVDVQCGKGTYIRSLAHDLGKKLGVGAYLTDLERKAVGAYRLQDAWELEQFIAGIRNQL
jgi:tRNA pseudouridine55 synthase